MKQSLLILILILTIISCSQNKNESNFSKTGHFLPTIEQRSLIIGQITNIKDFTSAPKRINLYVDDITIDSQHSFETVIDDEGKFIFNIPLYHSIDTYLKYGDGRIRPYLFPNDTLYLKCKTDRKDGRIGFVSGKFDEKHDKFQNDFFKISDWIHYQQINKFRDSLPQDLSPLILKTKYLAYEKELLKRVEAKICNDSLNELLSNYLIYSARYSIYESIIKLGRRIENKEERQVFYSFLTDSIAFNKNALITSDYNSFINKIKFDVESRPSVFLDPKERTKEELRMDITTKELEQNLKMRQGVWSEYLAASTMYSTGFLEEEISQSVITTYAELIEESFKDPYIKQILLSKCDETREKVAMINNQQIPEKAKLNQYASLSGEDLLDKILTDKKGKTIYIDIWATWCSPCKRQIPHSLKMQEMFKKVEFVYLCCQSEEETWHNVIKQYQICGTHILLNELQFDYLKAKFLITGVPHYILIDKNGKIDFNGYPGCKADQVIETKLKNLTVKK